MSFLFKFKTIVVVGVVESIDRYHRLVFFFFHIYDPILRKVTFY